MSIVKINGQVRVMISLQASMDSEGAEDSFNLAIESEVILSETGHTVW